MEKQTIDGILSLNGMAEMRRDKEETIKILCLLEKYRIKPAEDMFFRLALALANDYVKEFKDKKFLGRKVKWTLLSKGALVVEVERLTLSGNKDKSVSWACKQLAKRKTWEKFLSTRESDDGVSSHDPAEALRKIYYMFRNDKRANLFRDSFVWHEHKNTTSKWDELVVGILREPQVKTL